MLAGQFLMLTGDFLMLVGHFLMLEGDSCCWQEIPGVGS